MQKSDVSRARMEERRAIVQRLLLNGVYKLAEIQRALRDEYGIEASRSDVASDRRVALSALAAENAAVISDYRALWFGRLELIVRKMMQQLESGSANDQRRSAEVLLQVFAKANEVIGVEGALTAELKATPDLVSRLTELFNLLRERNMSPSDAFEAMINTLGRHGS